MSVLAELELTAESIEPGTRMRTLCPKCRGGDSGEESLSLFRDYSKRIAWKCFRAKCGFVGGPKGISDCSTKTSIKPKYFIGDYEPTMEIVGGSPFACVSNHRGLYLAERYGISSWDICWSEEHRCYVLPVNSPDGYRRGTQTYSFEKQPKTMNYRERVDEPFIHYTGIPGKCTSVVIVEDWFSAQKIYAAGARGVALLGTVLNRERIDEIKKSSVDFNVIIALDRDAQAKAIKYVIDYGGEFSPPMRLWQLRVDLKYESVERIKRALSNGDGDFCTGSYFTRKDLV